MSASHTATAVVPEGSGFPQARTPCLAKLDRRPWLTTLAVRVDPWHIGIRVNNELTRDLVEDTFASVRAAQRDGDVSANFSIEIGGHGSHSTRSLHLAYRDHEIAARRTDPAALVTDLVELVDETKRYLHPSVPMVSAAVVLTQAAEAIVLPGGVHRELLTRTRRLERASLELLRGRLHELDGDAATIVARPPTVATVVEGPGRTLFGRFPIKAWCVPSRDVSQHDIRPAELVHAAFSSVPNRHLVGADRTLQALARVAGRAPGMGLPRLTSVRLSEAVVDLAQ